MVIAVLSWQPAHAARVSGTAAVDAPGPPTIQVPRLSSAAPAVNPEAVVALEAAFGPGVTASVHPATGALSMVRFARPQTLPGDSAAARADEFLRAHGAAFGLDGPATSLLLRRIDVDNLGFVHLRYVQTVGGLAVFGSDLRLHFDSANRLHAVNGVLAPHLSIETLPSVSPSRARETALASVRLALEQPSAGPLVAGPATLTIYREGLLQGFAGPEHLSYDVEVTDGRSVRQRVFIDAHHASLLARFDGIAHGLFRRLYQSDTTNEIWTEGDAFPGFLDSWQQNEIVAAGHTYHLFFNAFGRDSYDGAGAELRTVHDDVAIICPNTNWNGVTTSFCSGTASDDLVAHEWGHAYTQHSSGLILAWQTGALNESFSDIWGETVDLLNGYEDADEDHSLRAGCGDSDRWLIGEDATAFGGAFRDMWNPNCMGDPAKVSDVQYVCNGSDSGGVHSNSGVPNRLYTLLVDGGTFNGHVVSPIGFVKAAHILFRAMSVYETAVSNFPAHADALEASCADLMGVNLEGISTSSSPAGPSGELISVTDCQELGDAIAAVELRQEACPGVFQPLLDPDAPALCAGGFAPEDIHRQDFESGLGSWLESQIPAEPSTWDNRTWTVTSPLPESRPGMAAFGPDPIVGDCGADLDNGIIRLESPGIPVPAGTPDTFLAFDHWVSLEESWDGGNLKISINGGAYSLVPGSAFTFNPYNGSLAPAVQGNDNPLAGQEAFTGANGGSLTGSWGQSQVDLSSIGVSGGDTVQLRFELGTDGCNGWAGWYVDDVRIFSCAATSVIVKDGFESVAP